MRDADAALPELSSSNRVKTRSTNVSSSRDSDETPSLKRALSILPAVPLSWQRACAEVSRNQKEVRGMRVGGGRCVRLV